MSLCMSDSSLWGDLWDTNISLAHISTHISWSKWIWIWKQPLTMTVFFIAFKFFMDEIARSPNFLLVKYLFYSVCTWNGKARSYVDFSPHSLSFVFLFCTLLFQIPLTSILMPWNFCCNLCQLSQWFKNITFKICTNSFQVFLNSF